MNLSKITKIQLQTETQPVYDIHHNLDEKVFWDERPNLIAAGKTIANCGRHAGGVLVCPNLEKHMPLITVRGELQTPWTEGVNIRNLEENGFLKFDFLGLNQMLMVEKCIRRILRSQTGKEPTFSDIKKFFDENMNCRYVEPNDSKVFQHVFKEGRFTGIFQLTGEGARKFCKAAKPENVLEFGAVTAIYRPGPLKANVHKLYVEAKKNPEKIVYDHPVLKNVMGDTHGMLCLAGDTMVLTEQGEMMIKDIVEAKLPVAVPSYNIETGNIEHDMITQFFDHGEKETIVIETDDGKLELTANHKVLTTRGWIEAGNLKITDELLHIAD